MVVTLKSHQRQLVEGSDPFYKRLSFFSPARCAPEELDTFLGERIWTNPWVGISTFCAKPPSYVAGKSPA